jgi:hypothetical protein
MGRSVLQNSNIYEYEKPVIFLVHLLTGFSLCKTLQLCFETCLNPQLTPWDKSWFPLRFWKFPVCFGTQCSLSCWEEPAAGSSLRKMNPVHATAFCFHDVQFNNNPHTDLVPSSGLLPSGFQTKSFMCIFLLSHSCCTPPFILSSSIRTY